MEQRLKLGKEPLSPLRMKIWRDHEDVFRKKVKTLNDKVDKLNMTCPALYMQMMMLNDKKEVRKVLDKYNDMAE